jgi:hypothetical protein
LDQHSKIAITTERASAFLPGRQTASPRAKPCRSDYDRQGMLTMDRTLKHGDLVRIMRVPEPVQDTDGFKTRSTLESCVGRVFPIMGFNDVDMIKIDVGEVNGKPAYMESIWIEPDCVELVAD